MGPNVTARLNERLIYPDGGILEHLRVEVIAARGRIAPIVVSEFRVRAELVRGAGTGFTATIDVRSF